MEDWQKGIFRNPNVFDVDALYTAKLIDVETISSNADGKLRFNYNVLDVNGELHVVRRSFNINDKKEITAWLAGHTKCNFNDPSMSEIYESHHLVEVDYYNSFAYIRSIFPLDGDLYVD